jgi:hypothetical protein
MRAYDKLHYWAPAVAGGAFFYKIRNGNGLSLLALFGLKEHAQKGAQTGRSIPWRKHPVKFVYKSAFCRTPFMMYSTKIINFTL